MSLRTGALERWWPTTQSLDLVEGSVNSVADAVLAEITRFAKGETLTASWRSFGSLDNAFRSVQSYANVPTAYLVLPTRSKWTVLWNNSFLCDGYDSLCWCLTANHGLTTLHWAAHDEWTTFQSGSRFTYRKQGSGAMAERSVYCGQEDKKWIFYQSGTPLPEEDLAVYEARRKRDRLNERIVAALLERLGAKPWSEDFYAVSEQQSYLVIRESPPPTVTVRRPEDVVQHLKGQC